MRITLIRHAQTAGNLAKQYIGSTDEPLSEEGRKTAQESLMYPQVAKVYTSGMLRTNQTAEILFPHADIIEVAALKEMDFGGFEGRNYEELKGSQEYQAWLDSNCEAPCPGGESKAQFESRCLKAFWHIIKTAPSSNEELYFVVHGGTIMALVSNLVEQEQGFFSFRANHCQAYVLELEHAPTDPNRPFRILSAE